MATIRIKEFKGYTNVEMNEHDPHWAKGVRIDNMSEGKEPLFPGRKYEGKPALVVKMEFNERIFKLKVTLSDGGLFYLDCNKYDSLHLVPWARY